MYRGTGLEVRAEGIVFTNGLTGCESQGRTHQVSMKKDGFCLRLYIYVRSGVSVE